jgi:hypothetical protein
MHTATHTATPSDNTSNQPPPQVANTPANWDDVDPLTLEPVSALDVWFEITDDTSGRVERYDAWAWLELLLRDAAGVYLHPVTRQPIRVAARAACVRACMEAASAEEASVRATCSILSIQPEAQVLLVDEQMQGVDKERDAGNEKRFQKVNGLCNNFAVKSVHARDPETGRLLCTRFFAANPAYEVVVLASWTKWDSQITLCPDWAKHVKSEAAVQYLLQDEHGQRVGGGTLWF